MGIRELKYFMVVVEEETIVAASRKLYVSQSSISRGINILEKRMGVPLLEHIPFQNMTLTSYGKLVYDQAKQIVDMYERMMEETAVIRDEERKKLVIGSSPVIMNLFLSDILFKLRKKNPEIIQDIQENGDSDSYLALSDEVCDFIVVMGRNTSEGMERVSLYKDQMLAVLPHSNPLSVQNVLTINQIYDQHLYLYNTNYPSTDAVLNRCKTAGFIPRIEATYTDCKYLIQALEKTHDMAIVPAPALKDVRIEDYQILPFSPKIEWEVSLVYKSGKVFTKSMHDFMELILSEFETY